MHNCQATTVAAASRQRHQCSWLLINFCNANFFNDNCRRWLIPRWRWIWWRWKQWNWITSFIKQPQSADVCLPGTAISDDERLTAHPQQHALHSVAENGWIPLAMENHMLWDLFLLVGMMSIAIDNPFQQHAWLEVRFEIGPAWRACFHKLFP